MPEFVKVKSSYVSLDAIVYATIDKRDGVEDVILRLYFNGTPPLMALLSVDHPIFNILESHCFCHEGDCK